ncbi:hypothetical protein CBR_g29908 [Chara braunii]|uniref:CCHC-type domain-containing protein n=1 Tax=Chara braunii TaxID=69332 RepID=A0A388JWZ7_CHABU|nr:hypothetical protein CBR_g29908 [Chara braunii]|eukprot:GBG62298.1 hypothetical protein CBR_g29908 [Chara braunii]
MRSRRSESWGRHERRMGYESGGWDSGDDRRDRGRERGRRYDDRRGSSTEDYGRRNDGGRQVKCYECGEYGRYKSQCPRLQGRLTGGTISLSRDLEESLSSVGRMTRQLLEQQREAEEVKREAEKMNKKEAEEREAREEEARVTLQKKLAKEEKEKKRSWELKKLLVEQREEYEAKLDKVVGLSRKMKGVSIGSKKKEKANVTPVMSSKDEEETEEEAMPLKDKRKRKNSTGEVENSPPVETPKKMGKNVEVETLTGQKRKGRGRPTKAEAQATRVMKGEDPWEGVPVGEKFATEAAYRRRSGKPSDLLSGDTESDVQRGRSTVLRGERRCGHTVRATRHVLLSGSEDVVFNVKQV